MNFASFATETIKNICPSTRFNPDILPDLSDRVAIVTGGNTGIGRPTVAALAKKGAKVYLGARSVQRADEAIAAIKKDIPDANVIHLQLDLSDFASVKNAVDEFLSKENKLHILVNNAGIMATPYSETPQGYEIQFGTNYLGHFLLTKLLLPTILNTAATSPVGTVRIVNVSSTGHELFTIPEGINFENPNMKEYSTWTRYGQSKLANILHSKALADRYGSQNVLTASLHPGGVNTELARGPIASSMLYYPFRWLAPFVTLTPEKGALSNIFAAASPEYTMEKNGQYFTALAVEGTPSKFAMDKELRDRLWDWTEKELAKHGL